MKFTVEELGELNNPGTTLGYWAKGHLEKQEFAIAVNKEFDLPCLGKFAPVSAVEHCWYRFVPYVAEYGDRTQMIQKLGAPSRGATPVTFIDYEGLGCAP
jgi:hypothetical protein